MSIIDKKRIEDYKINESVFDEYINKCLNITDNNINLFTNGFPHVSNKLKYSEEKNKLWTSGFFPGIAYLCYGLTKDEKFLRNKEIYLESFKDRMEKGHMETHDIGFLYTLSCVALYKLTGDKKAYDIAICSADKLAKRYNSMGEFIQAWGKIGIGVPDVKIIIDCMMNLPLLYWTAEEKNDSKYFDIAKNHALTSSKYLLRNDGSTYHTYLMDPISGRAIVGKTHQGRFDETTWSRGQAWSIYGFTLSYAYTKEEFFLEAALKSADYFINNLPKDFISYWDFSFTDVNPDIKDTSAASIAASGLLELSKYVEGNIKFLYEKTAKIILQQLCVYYFTPNGSNGFLKEGMYHRDDGAEECTSWGDYFFLEALYKTKKNYILFW